LDTGLGRVPVDKYVIPNSPLTLQLELRRPLQDRAHFAGRRPPGVDRSTPNPWCSRRSPARTGTASAASSREGRPAREVTRGLRSGPGQPAGGSRTRTTADAAPTAPRGISNVLGAQQLPIASVSLAVRRRGDGSSIDKTTMGWLEACAAPFARAKDGRGRLQKCKAWRFELYCFV
jgi:hypothetical protein